MTRLFACIALAPLLLADDTVTVLIRGRTHTLAHIRPRDCRSGTAVLFLPGDGGWRGAAVRMANTVAVWGFDVYGFDTKEYLEACSRNGTKLTRDELGADLRSIAEQVNAFAKKPVLFVGWSQGAGMAVAAIAGGSSPSLAQGLITLGLPESAVLGWNWRAAMAVLANRDTGQPSFAVAPLLPHLAPARIWMIYGSEDEYTQPEREHELFRAASEPKHLQEIAGANHRFDGHQSELFRSMRAALEWIVGD